MNAVLRIAIVNVAVFSIWQFSRPVLALSAIALSATNRRLLHATIPAILAAVIYAAPLVAFIIGITIYGF